MRAADIREAASHFIAAAVVAAAIAGAIVLGLRFAERCLLFPAPSAPAHAPVLQGSTQQVWLETLDGRIEALLLLPKNREARWPLILHAHGNGELIDDWVSSFEPVTANGIAVLLVEYPGYGRSQGRPSEESIQRAMVAGYDWAVSLPHIDENRVIGYGSSLGGGAICTLARLRPLAALDLESTFTSVVDWVAERPAPIAALRNLVQNRFENLDFIRTYNAPVLVLHGSQDGMIPATHAHQLSAAARFSELELLACGHNDCPRQWPAILRFLGKHNLLAAHGVA